MGESRARRRTASEGAEGRCPPFGHFSVCACSRDEGHARRHVECFCRAGGRDETRFSCLLIDNIEKHKLVRERTPNLLDPLNQGGEASEFWAAFLWMPCIDDLSTPKATGRGSTTRRPRQGSNSGSAYADTLKSLTSYLYP